VSGNSKRAGSDAAEQRDAADEVGAQGEQLGAAFAADLGVGRT
jgi:hypothetical protein